MLSLPRTHLKKLLTEGKTNCMGEGGGGRESHRATLLILQDTLKERGQEGFPPSTTLQEWSGLNAILLCLTTVITFAYQVRQRSHRDVALSWHTTFSDPFSFVCLFNFFVTSFLQTGRTKAGAGVLWLCTWTCVRANDVAVFSVFPAPIKVNFQMPFWRP